MTKLFQYTFEYIYKFCNAKYIFCSKSYKYNYTEFSDSDSETQPQPSRVHTSDHQEIIFR